MIEDKISLTRKRVELIEGLKAVPLSTEERVRLQGELSITNAKIKALNTTEAARNKAAADRRKVAGLAEAHANAARARANAGLQHHFNENLACPACGTDSTVGCIAGSARPDDDDDPGQTEAIDSWIDAVLLRHDIEFVRNPKGRIMLTNDPSHRAPMEQPLAAAIELLVSGIYAAARGQELPDLPAPPKPTAKPAAKPTKPTPAPKSKKR